MGAARKCSTFTQLVHVTCTPHNFSVLCKSWCRERPMRDGFCWFINTIRSSVQLYMSWEFHSKFSKWSNCEMSEFYDDWKFMWLRQPPLCFSWHWESLPNTAQCQPWPWSEICARSARQRVLLSMTNFKTYLLQDGLFWLELDDGRQILVVNHSEHECPSLAEAYHIIISHHINILDFLQFFCVNNGSFQIFLCYLVFVFLAAHHRHHPRVEHHQSTCWNVWHAILCKSLHRPLTSP